MISQMRCETTIMPAPTSDMHRCSHDRENLSSERTEKGEMLAGSARTLFLICNKTIDMMDRTEASLSKRNPRTLSSSQLKFSSPATLNGTSVEGFQTMLFPRLDSPQRHAPADTLSGTHSSVAERRHARLRPRSRCPDEIIGTKSTAGVSTNPCVDVHSTPSCHVLAGSMPRSWRETNDASYWIFSTVRKNELFISVKKMMTNKNMTTKNKQRNNTRI